MSLTGYPNGISSFGIPVIGSGQVPVTNGKYYFVDGTNGSDNSAGQDLTTSLKTIAAAAALVAANDTILVFPGTYTEAAVTISVAGVRIIGMGASPKQVVWTSATDVKSLTLAAANCEVANIQFTPPTYTAGIPASIALSSANYAYIHNCRFQGQAGSWNAIYSAVCNSDNVRIENNEFMYLNTATYGAAILGVEAGGLSYSGWRIKGNVFESCVTAVNINGRVCTVEGNHFAINGINAAGAGAAVCTKALNLSGTSSYGNMVHGNYLGGTYGASLYTVGASGDDWSGNWNIAGVTAANPA
jgi:hypothetical protein